MRSKSAPPQLQRTLEEVQEGIQDVLRLQRWRTAVQKKNDTDELNLEDGVSDNTKQSFYSTLDEIFSFLGSNLENTVMFFTCFPRLFWKNLIMINYMT